MTSIDYYYVIIQKYLAGEITPEEELLLYEWMAKDPENKEVFEHICRVWDTRRPFPELSESQLKEGYKMLRLRIAESEARARLRREKRYGRYKSAVIAVLLLALGALMAWPREDADATIRTSSLANQEVHLPDHSRVVLNQGSTIDFTIGRHRREATISGEALFEVERGEAPFLISGEGFSVEVLGTTVLVRAYPGQPVEVFVIEGSVKATYPQGDIVVNAGERVSLDSIRGPLKSSFIDPNFNAWYTHALEFKDTELAKILTLMEELYGARFQLNDPGILRCTFNGRFAHAELDKVLDVLSYSLHIEFRRTAIEETGLKKTGLKGRQSLLYIVSGTGCSFPP